MAEGKLATRTLKKCTLIEAQLPAEIKMSH